MSLTVEPPDTADGTAQLPARVALRFEPSGTAVRVPPGVTVFDAASWNGIAIDVEWLRSLKTRFEGERKRVEQEIYAEAGEEFNINSNPQLRAILFEKLKLPSRKKTATGPSGTIRWRMSERGSGARSGIAGSMRTPRWSP